MDYFEKKPLLLTDYDRFNPITKIQSNIDFDQYLSKLDEKKELPNEAEMIKFKVSNVRKRRKQER